MSREIRKVVKGWKHPKYESGEYKPMYDKDFDTALQEWLEEYKLWKIDPDSQQIEDDIGAPPDPEYYRPKWKEKDMVYFQVYETVSEGSPVTPVFKTKQELTDHLIKHGTYWKPTGFTKEQAEGFVKTGFAPSMIIASGKMYSGIETGELLDNKEE